MRALLACICLGLLSQPVFAQTKPKPEKKPKPTSRSKKTKTESFPWLDNALPRNRQLKVGDKGTIFLGRIERVIDKSAALVTYYYATAPSPNGGEHDLIKPETLWVETDTTSFVDGRDWEARLDQFEIVGTKSYESRAGKRTVLHLVRIQSEDKAKKAK